MGKRNAPSESGQLVQLIMQGSRPRTLVQTDEDWQALGAIAARMLFWCGGFIHGCRCEANEMRFAVQVGRAPIGAMAQHIATAYAKRLRQRLGWRGSVFKHYHATPLADEVFLDDLVMWLHRPVDLRTRGKPSSPIWTADAAYLTRRSLTWVTTERVLQALSIGAPGPAAYRRRKSQPIAPEILDLFTGPRQKRAQRRIATPHTEDSGERVNDSPTARNLQRPSVETIARAVADYSRLDFDDMRSASRKGSLSRARAIATVLCTRNGATVAAVARLFDRSRSTLIEQADHYRKTQPQLFAEAETALAHVLDSARP
jgi:hypothetical protein